MTFLSGCTSQAESYESLVFGAAMTSVFIPNAHFHIIVLSLNDSSSMIDISRVMNHYAQKKTVIIKSRENCEVSF